MKGHEIIRPFLASFLQKAWEAIVKLIIIVLGTHSNATKAENMYGMKSFKDIPGPRAFPFFGTVFTSGSKKDLISHCEGHVLKYGPLVREEWYWNYPLIVVYDADDIETVMASTKYIRPGLEIMKKCYKNFPDETKYFHGGMANANGREWMNIRAASKSIQSTRFVETFLPSGDEIAMTLVDILNNVGPTIEDLSIFLTRSAIENNFQLCFGKKLGILQKDKVNEDPKVMQLETDIKTFWSSLNDSVKGYPWWRNVRTNTWKQYVKAEMSIYKFISQSVDNILANSQLDGLSWWIMQCAHIEDNERKDALFEYCVATQSTATTLHIMFQLIAENNEIQDTLYEELKSVIPTKCTKLDAQMLKNLPYLKACINEAFRMVPVAPNLVRISEEALNLKGYHIPPHTLLLCQTWYNCLRKENFDRPDEFLPERWISGSNLDCETLRQNTRMMTHFGVGKRSCPAKKFALQELIITLARVFRNFKLDFEEKLQFSYEFLQSPVNVPLRVHIQERPD